MKTWTRSQIKSGLKKLVPDIDFLKNSEEFDEENKGGLWTSGESDWKYEGLPVFDYYCESDYLMKDAGFEGKSSYVFGVHKDIHKWLEERGWYPEWNDPGTLMLGRI